MSDPGLPGGNPSIAYWQVPVHDLAAHRSTAPCTQADVVIIGSGITGASVAYHLLKASPSLSVTMLEARNLTSGATGRNGGHCKDVPFKTYKQWKEIFGVKAAQRLVRFRSSHVPATKKLAEELKQEGFGDALFRSVESVTAAFDDEIFRELRANMEEWLEDFPEQRGSCAAYEGKDADEKYGFIGASGVLTLPAGALWPYRLVTNVIKRLRHKHSNFSLETWTPVANITASGGVQKPYLVHTTRGTIQTQHVVHCTNGHVAHLLPALRGKIVPVRGQMTALTPSAKFPRLGHTRSWSLYYPNGGFDYMTQASGEEGVVFLGGGVDQGASAGVVELGSTKDDEMNRPALQHLCSVLPKYFKHGEGTKLKQAWTGIMGFTPDAFPVVGKVPRDHGNMETRDEQNGDQWIAAGFNGYGMVQCWRSGQAVADMISGVPDETVNEWFPREQFECSRARLERMDYKTLHDTFYKNAPTQRESKL